MLQLPVPCCAPRDEPSRTGIPSRAAAEFQVSVAFLSGTAEPGHLERRSKEQGEGRGREGRAGSC